MRPIAIDKLMALISTPSTGQRPTSGTTLSNTSVVTFFPVVFFHGLLRFDRLQQGPSEVRCSIKVTVKRLLAYFTGPAAGAIIGHPCATGPPALSGTE